MERSKHPFERRRRRVLDYARQVGLDRQARLYNAAAYENWSSVNRLGAITAIRQIAASSNLAQAYIHHTRLNVIGNHCPVPTFSNIEEDRTRKPLLELWEEFAADPSVNGGEDLAGVLRAMITSLIIDGRVFGIIRRHRSYRCGMAVMPLERDWLQDDGNDTEVEYKVEGRSYRGINGVIRDPMTGRVSHYVFYGSPDPQQVIKERRAGFAASALILHANSTYKAFVVPADMVADLYISRTASDFEGSVSHLMPMLQTLQHLAGLDASVLAAMDGASRKMGFIERTETSPNIEELPDSVEAPAEEFEANHIEELPPGYKFTPYDPQAPNANIKDYRQELIKNAAAAFGLDHAAISGDLREVNYSSIRAGMVKAQEGYRILQGEIERKVLVPLLARLIDCGQMLGRTRIGKATARKALLTPWRHRSWDWVDPDSDMKANVAAVKLGIESPQRLAAGRGADWEAIQRDLKQAAETAKKNGTYYEGAEEPEPPAPVAPAPGGKPGSGGRMTGNGPAAAKPRPRR